MHDWEGVMERGGCLTNDVEYFLGMKIRQNIFLCMQSHGNKAEYISRQPHENEALYISRQSHKIRLTIF